MLVWSAFRSRNVLREKPNSERLARHLMDCTRHRNSFTHLQTLSRYGVFITEERWPLPIFRILTTVRRLVVVNIPSVLAVRTSSYGPWRDRRLVPALVVPWAELYYAGSYASTSTHL